MSTTLRSLIVKVGADISDMEKGFKKASKELKNMSKDFTSTGATLTKGLTVPIVGAVAGLAKMAIEAGKAADELITLSNKTGISTQQLQEMEYAARFVDVPLETMTSSMMKLTKNMDNAQKGLKDQTEAFDKLGVSYLNVDGSLRDSKEVWADVINALGTMENETERDAVALRLFGRSAQELNPLIAAGGDALNEFAAEAKKLGLVLSEEEVAALGKFDDARERFSAGLKVAAERIGVAFLPVMEKIMPVIQDQIVPALQHGAEWLGDMVDKFMNADPAMQKFILILAAIAVGIGPVFSLIGKITGGLSGLMSGLAGASKALGAGQGLMGALSALLGPAGIALAAIAAIAGIAYLVINNWEPIKEFFSGVGEKIKSAFDGVGEFISGIFDGINEAIDGTIGWIEDVIEWFGELFGVFDEYDARSKGAEERSGYSYDKPATTSAGMSGIQTQTTIINQPPPASENINLSLNIDGQTLARQTYTHFNKQANVQGPVLVQQGGR